MNILWVVFGVIALWVLLRFLAGLASPRRYGDGPGAEVPRGRQRLRATAAHRPQLLAENGLPNLASRDDLAQALGIPRGALDWLTFPDAAKEPPHYSAFAVPKRSGGYRVLYAPKPRLKAAQQWIRREILAKTHASESAHGFVETRSILTNAAPHAGRDIVLTLDLDNFFPSVTYRRVRGIFQSLGYGEEMAIPLALLCTVRPAEKVREFVGGQRHRMLPQGAPTSPALANLACRHLDARLDGLAAKFGCVYTRYADDLTFSGDEAFARSLKRFLPLVHQIVSNEGFKLKKGKTHYARRGARQEVTGLVVNDGPRVPRAYRRRLRAILHNARKTGLEAQNRGKHPHFAHALRGRIEFIRSTHPQLASQLLAELKALG
ncbi:MAG TPA: reverse transcriptase family protein [Planctomycetota bacterium]|nr:reverse transcriptase family protein [Planctomycetota bacterium]HRR79070.1 reverse transcriptase family protein [Planctomycetota bacterium]HRT93020.1 reverse transcriptase family protein [Planctomycetota bacterium]